MKILVLTNYGDAMQELNALTSPNKEAYCLCHGYDFVNILWKYENHAQWLRLILEKIEYYDIVMTMGCDTIFTNHSIMIEDKAAWQIPNVKTCPQVTIAKEHLKEWPINNDVMIWPKSDQSRQLLHKLADDESIWIKYPWLWQHHLWNLMQKDRDIAACVRLFEAREMNSTFQPFIVGGNQMTRLPGPSSWQIGDWILHALDMPYEMRIQVIKWGLVFAGDGSWEPIQKNLDEKTQLN